ncbi:hypothetical protein [Halomarina pelagica]|uniref:hypothetical protein n=1 Tax=Halomarina pelagica TaxID=2961599 RepID=UPI0020C40748|nr:hypothetical protein [Halomarina sp. BND7]
MDYKDLVVVGLAFLIGNVGAAAGGPLGAVAGIVVGAGIGAKWAAESDRVRYLEGRVEELEARVGEP